MNKKTAITPTRENDFPEWYQQVIKNADLAEHSVSRGCMVIKPYGYGIWENIQSILDKQLKKTGHVNASFPSLIPLAFLEKEAEHVEGFAKECAVVTHCKLEKSKEGNLVPAGKLSEPFILRPTSETIIGDSYSKWVSSYRDLPILINQWANVFRWEMRTRLFLRTSEFLWQEGHTAHATEKEALEEALLILKLYENFLKEYLSIPVISGMKTDSEKFPGAFITYTIEAMMQDGKAVQAGTSHFLAQNFAKASNIKFQDADGVEQYAWTTSWGVSTRLIGALIMTHSDDNGLVLPPKIAPYHVVIQPIYKTDEEREVVIHHIKALKSELETLQFDDINIVVNIDDRYLSHGNKAWSNIKKGVPVRIEIGPRDITSDTFILKRRDEDPTEKHIYSHAQILENLPAILISIQNNLYQKAKKFRDENKVAIDNLPEFKKYFTQNKKPGFAKVPYAESEDPHPVLKELKVTARCICMDSTKPKNQKCIFTGKLATNFVYFARAY